MSALRALVKAATPGPWATQHMWPLFIVPESHRDRVNGAATDPRKDAERYSQPIAAIRLDTTSPSERFPHRRVYPEIAKADARLIALAPDLALLVADMGEKLKDDSTYECWCKHGSPCTHCERRTLLARLAEIEERLT